MNKGRVLITGGAGFIGSHTADALAKKGFKIRILDSLEPNVHRNRAWPSYVREKGYELFKGSIRNAGYLKKALRGVTYVYHFAAYQDQKPDFSTFFDINTEGTALIYEIIVREKFPIKKIILASSQFSYGDGFYKCSHGARPFSPELRSLAQLMKKEWDIRCPHGGTAKSLPFKESQILNPTNSYGLSKQAMEILALKLGKTYKIPTTVFRYSVVQGPRQSPYNIYSGALRIFVSQALAGVPITVYEDGKQVRDFVNVNDVAAANVLALTNKKTDFEVFNVGGGKGYKIIDFAKIVQRATGTTSKILIGAFRRTDSRHEVSNISKLKRVGWKPRYTPEISVRAYVKWFKEEGFDKFLNKSALKNLKKGVTT